MYRCQECKKVSKPGQQAITKVTETRGVVFPFRKDAQRRYGKCAHPPADDPDKNCRDDHGGSGTQIVSQILICRDCKEAGEQKAT